MTIYPWDKEVADPYTRMGSASVIKAGLTIKKGTARPNGSKQYTGFVGKSATQVNSLEFVFCKETKFWGLVKTGTNTWTQYRMWEINTYGGLPKKYEADTKSNGLIAVYFDGTWTGGAIKEGYGNYPVFKVYGRQGSSYYEILSESEVSRFPIGTSPASQQQVPPRGTPPPAIPPITGPSSGTGVTIGSGVLPSGMFIPDLTGWLGELNFLPSPSTNNPGTNPNTRPGTNTGGTNRQTGGQYVTGPDGKRYWLPPNIDFEGLKREYDRRNPKPETKIVVRMPKGYIAPKVTNGSKPRMTQIQLDLTESGRAIGTVTKTFVFPYIPQNIRYSDIGSDWQEIPRALNAPLLDWNRYKLLKVSMDFLVSAQFKPGGPTQIDTVSDGLFNSVTGELNLLREMATNKFPVYLEGFDDILQVQMKRSRFEAPKGMQFVINDLNITAGRRTIDPNTGLATTPSLIAAAQVSMTLTEVPIETVTLVKLPPLDLGTPLVGKPGDGSSGGGIPGLGLQSSTLTGVTWELAT